MKQKKLVIFDWDGTVMDSVGQIVASLCYAAEQHDIELSPHAAKNIIGLGLPEAMRVLFPDHEAQHDSLKQMYSQHYVQKSKHTPLFAGMQALIAQLHGNNTQLAVATGKSRAGLNRVLRDSQLGGYFAATRGADETRSKPHPLMLEEILAQTGVGVADAVMVGDTSYDMEMAQNIHMDRIGVTYGVHEDSVLSKYAPNHIVADVTALHALLI